MHAAQSYFPKKKKSLISLFYPFLGDFRFLQRFTRYLRSSGMLRNIGGLFYTDVSVVITASRYLTTKHRPHDSLQNCVHLPAFFVDRLTLEGGKYMLFRNVRNKLTFYAVQNIIRGEISRFSVLFCILVLFCICYYFVSFGSILYHFIQHIWLQVCTILFNFVNYIFSLLCCVF